MSLDVYLHEGKCATCGRGDQVFSSNITHNLGRMAEAAGVYEACWRPDEHGYLTARHIMPVLERGIAALEARPGDFAKYNDRNGWGTYDQFLPWLKEYFAACQANPDALVDTCR